MKPSTVKIEPEAVPHVKLDFSHGTRWKLAYQRNNKSRIQKNLRCFPNCSLLYGHQDGFCGQTVSITMDINPKEMGIELEDIIPAGEFAVLGSEPRAINSIVTMDMINKHEGVNDGFLTFIEGVQVSEPPSPDPSLTSKIELRPGFEQVHYQFNKHLKGWHYGFLGSKKTRNMYHVFRAYVLAKVPNVKSKEGRETYRVLAHCTSPAWQMYCRRRKNNSPELQLLEDSQRPKDIVAPHPGHKSASRKNNPRSRRSSGASSNVKVHGQKEDLNSSNTKTEFQDNIPQQTRQILGPKTSLISYQHGKSGDLAINSDCIKRSAKRGSHLRSPLNASILKQRSRHCTTTDEDSLDLTTMSLDSKGMRAPNLVSRRPPAVQTNMFSGMMKLSPLNLSITPATSRPYREPSSISDLRWELVTQLLQQMSIAVPLRGDGISLATPENVSSFAADARAFLSLCEKLYDDPRWVNPKVPKHVEEYICSAGSLNEIDHFALHLITSQRFSSKVNTFVNKPEIDDNGTAAFILRLFRDMLEDFLQERASGNRTCQDENRRGGNENITEGSNHDLKPPPPPEDHDPTGMWGRLGWFQSTQTPLNQIGGRSVSSSSSSKIGSLTDDLNRRSGYSSNPISPEMFDSQCITPLGGGLSNFMEDIDKLFDYGDGSARKEHPNVSPMPVSAAQTMLSPSMLNFLGSSPRMLNSSPVSFGGNYLLNGASQNFVSKLNHSKDQPRDSDLQGLLSATPRSHKQLIENIDSFLQSTSLHMQSINSPKASSS